MIGPGGARAGLLVASLRGLLSELAGVIGSLTDARYTEPRAPVPGPIGAHVRHVLDHVAALDRALVLGCAEYDRRERGTAVERQRRAALAAIEALDERLARIPDEAGDRPIRVAVLDAATGAVVETTSTLAREIAFVTSHAVHHHAMIGAIVRSFGAATPEGFGVAPSTAAHLDRLACAR